MNIHLPTIVLLLFYYFTLKTFSNKKKSLICSIYDLPIFIITLSNLIPFNLYKIYIIYVDNSTTNQNLYFVMFITIDKCLIQLDVGIYLKKPIKKNVFVFRGRGKLYHYQPNATYGIYHRQFDNTRVYYRLLSP